MNIGSKLVVLAVMSLVCAVGQGRAFAEEKHKNLKVLEDHKQLENGMKQLNKGLGTKCEACHVKGELDSDKVPAKEEARKFLGATVGEADKAKRDEALKQLLTALKLPSAKHPEDVWKGVDMFKKKP